jgi:hypothetical protein
LIAIRQPDRRWCCGAGSQPCRRVVATPPLSPAMALSIRETPVGTKFAVMTTPRGKLAQAAEPRPLTLAEARQTFAVAADKLRDPAHSHEAVRAVEAVIVWAHHEQAQSGRLKLEASRVLGEFLRDTPRLKGRPKKESSADSLPLLADLGITDRHVAADALKVAAVSEAEFRDYLAQTDEPSFRGLLRFARPARDEELAREEEEEFEREQTKRFYDFIDNDNTTFEWYTPKYIFDALNSRFDLDPASPGREIVPWIPVKKFYTVGGLERAWRGFVWLNPPFGRETLPLWTEKFTSHGNGIALVPERTSTVVARISRSCRSYTVFEQENPIREFDGSEKRSLRHW